MMEQNNMKMNNQMIKDKDNEILNLKNELNKANKIIENQTTKINDLQNQLNNLNNIINNNNISIENYKNIINQKDEELNKLKSNNNVYNNIKNKELFSLDQIISISFISTDESVYFSVPCISSNTFSEIEEKLYQKYPEYRETNNKFLVNGKEISRFKTIAQNKIENGLPVTMIISP